MTNLSDLNKYYRTNDATAVAADIALGETAYVAGGLLTGTKQPHVTEFDANDYFTKTTGFTTDAVTFIARVNLPVPTGSTHVIFETGYGSGSPQGYGIYIVASNVENPVMFLQDSTGAILVKFRSSVDFCDGNNHTFWFAYDGINGLATLLVDGVNADDIGYSSRVAPIVGSINKYASSIFRYASQWWTAGGHLVNGSQFSSLGLAKTYLTNYSDFFNSSGGQKNIDESTWAEFGGIQPYIWKSDGWVAKNLGSWGAFTVVGNPIVVKGS